MQVSSANLSASLNQTAAVLFAAAVTELFPGVLLVRGQGGIDRFYYDLIFPFEFQDQFLTLIEERMRLIIREKRPVRLMEMMPSNAASLMRHHGQPIIAERLENLERAFVPMCKIGDFVDFSPIDFQENLHIPFLKIFEGFLLPLLGMNVIRIVGAASLEKDALKKIAKQPAASTRSHLKLVKEMQMFSSLEEQGLWLWQPKGGIVRDLLINWWRQEHLKQNFSLVSSPAPFLEEGREEGLRQSHKEYFSQCGLSKIAEVNWIAGTEGNDPTLGLFSTSAFYSDRAHLFCPEEKLLQECISSLHFILKIPKILGFEFEIVLSVSSLGAQKARSKGMQILQQALEQVGIPYTLEKNYRVGILASIELRFADSLGGRWTGPFVSIPETPVLVGKGCMLVRSAFGSLERLLALLIEKRGGWLPLWLAPEQVRILALNSKADRYADEVFKALKTQGIRAAVESGENKIKTQLYTTILEKVPYVVLLGEREVKANSLTVRNNAENEEQSSTLEEFCVRLKDEIGSGNSELTN